MAANDSTTTPNIDIYKVLGWAAMLLTPLAPALFFGWRAYTAALEMTALPTLAVIAGSATAAGLELVGVLAGHTAIEYHQRRDRRWWFAAVIMTAYVAIGTAELWGNSIGRVTFLIAALVYLLVGLRHGLETAVAEEAARADRQQRLDEALALRKLQYQHEEKLARIEAKSRQETRQIARQETRQDSGNLPTDWRQLTAAQRHELAHMTRGERENIMPEIADRTRRVWHERLDAIAAQNGHGGAR